MDSKTTQTTTLPEASAEEKKMQDYLLNSLFPAMMSEAGFVEESFVDPKAKKKYQSNYARIAEINNQIGQLKAGVKTAADMQRFKAQENQLVTERNGLEAQLKDYETSWPKVRMRKRESDELEALREKFGVDSREYKTVKARDVAKQSQMKADQEEITKLFVQNTKKFLSGDFAASDDQKKLIQEQLAPERALVEKMFGDAASVNSKDFSDQLKKFNEGADQMGLDLERAVGVVGAQVLRTGQDVEKALSSTIQARQELMKMNVEDITGELTKKISANAAAMGRDPNDPEYQRDIQQATAREITRANLELGAFEAEKKMGIKERTGAGLEGVLSQQASAQLGLEEIRRNMEFQAGAGMTPQQVGLGMNVAQFQNALAQQRLQNIQSLGAIPSSILEQQQRLRMSQPTSTQIQSSSPFEALLGLGTGVAGAYSGIASAGALRQIAAKETPGTGYNFGGAVP